ncbi:MAG: transposase [Dehalococcoidia bacterium]
MEDAKIYVVGVAGRPNYYHPESLLRAILASYYLGLKSTAAIVRRLQEDPILAITCGFSPNDIPHRSTFSRFNKKLTKHQHTLNNYLDIMSTSLKSSLPDYGKVIAVDSTPVRSHSNPDKKPVSDAEADWIVKGGPVKKDWCFGYKLHAVVDTESEIPVCALLTSAKVSDTEFILPLLRETAKRLSWFRPEIVTADKGYDSTENYQQIAEEFDASPVIPKRVYSKVSQVTIDESSQIPKCIGGYQLKKLWHHKDKGTQYECPARSGKTTCPLPEKCGLKTKWIKDGHIYRDFGYRIMRGSEQWTEAYHKRSSAERVFSRLKQTRRLESHCFRGFDMINLHSTLSVLTMQAIALVKVQSGLMSNVRDCVRHVG